MNPFLPLRIPRIFQRWAPPQNSLNIPTPLLDKLIKVSQEFLWAIVRLLGHSGVGMDHTVLTHRIIRRTMQVVERLDQLKPRPAGTMNRHAFMYAVGGTHFGQRRTCNAAVALTYLRTRENHRPADRLAIMANLCDYELRLNAMGIETSFTSLAVCLFALAFINGDLSLLVPEIYQQSSIKGEVRKRSAPAKTR